MPLVGEVAVTPWSGSAGIQLRRHESGVTPTAVTFEVGVWVDDIRARVQAAGLAVVDPPEDRPWGRRDFTFTLPEGTPRRRLGRHDPRQRAQ